MVVGLPCAVRGACAHGNRTAPATDSAVPHDSAAPTDTQHAQVCNTHHPPPPGYTRAPARSGSTVRMCPRPPRGPCEHRQADTPVRPRYLHRPRRTRAPADDLLFTRQLTCTAPGACGHRAPRPRRRAPENHHNPDTHPYLRCNNTPQTQHRTGPISTRNTTDLDAEYDRSRRGGGSAGDGQPRGPSQAAAASSTRLFSSRVPTETRTPSPAKGRTSTPAAAKCSARRAVASPTPSQ